MPSPRIQIGFILDLTVDPNQIPAYAQYAERARFASLWIGEPPSFMNGPAVAALAASATSTLPIGFGLTNPYTRHATVNATNRPHRPLVPSPRSPFIQPLQL